MRRDAELLTSQIASGLGLIVVLAFFTFVALTDGPIRENPWAYVALPYLGGPFALWWVTSRVVRERPEVRAVVFVSLLVPVGLIGVVGYFLLVPLAIALLAVAAIATSRAVAEHRRPGWRVALPASAIPIAWFAGIVRFAQSEALEVSCSTSATAGRRAPGAILRSCTTGTPTASEAVTFLAGIALAIWCAVLVVRIGAARGQASVTIGSQG